MDPVNPYAAPQATLDHLDGAMSAAARPPLEILLSFQGRISRAQYWGYFMISMLLSFGASAGCALVLNAAGASKLAALVSLLVYLPLSWVGLALQVKRLHDRDKSGWWLLLHFVPFANIWIGIEIAFLPGTNGVNDYGPPPVRRV